MAIVDPVTYNVIIMDSLMSGTCQQLLHWYYVTVLHFNDQLFQYIVHTVAAINCMTIMQYTFDYYYRQLWNDHVNHKTFQTHFVQLIKPS